MSESSDIHSSYDLLQNQFPEAIIILDPQAKILAVDKQTLLLFGWESESELVGKDGMTFVVEEDRDKTKYVVSKVLSDNYVKDITFRALKKDGTTIHVAGSASLLVDNQGNPKEIVIIVHDVALQNAGIEQLKEAEQQLSEAQQIAHFGSWTWDVTTNTFHWTDELYRLFNMTPQTQPVNNDVMLSLIYPEDKEKVKSFIDASLRDGAAVLDFRVGNADSTEVQWLHGRNKTFYDEQHKPVRMVGTVHDVTHEKEIDKVKTQFLSLASHQLRGPLTTINWHAEMLLQQQAEGLSETQKKYIQELYNASKRTVQLTNALLNVSSLELGTMPFKPEDLSLEKTAKRVLEDYQNQIAEKHLTFNEEYAENLPMIKTDLFLLKTIYHTLISNAVNYTPDGGKIDFHVGLDPQQKETFLISISDTGYGIPKDQQDKIFTKLFRAPNAKAKVMNGTGLDLYIVKLILALNGGEISFVSEENKGTTFTITLPFIPKPVQQEAENA